MTNIEDIKPVELKTDTTPDAKKRVTIFTIADAEGKKTEYTIPAKPRPNIALKYMWTLKTTGNGDTAAAQLLEDMLGEEGYMALMAWDDLEVEQFKNILDICKDVSMGGMEEAMGN